jgi:hypothetical protein
MITAAELAQLRPIIVAIVLEELAARAPLPAPPHVSSSDVHPVAGPVHAFLESLPADGTWLTSAALHAAFLASPYARGIAARASVQVVCIMAARERGRLVESCHNGDVGRRYRRLAPRP